MRWLALAAVLVGLGALVVRTWRRRPVVDPSLPERYRRAWAIPNDTIRKGAA